MNTKYLSLVAVALAGGGWLVSPQAAGGISYQDTDLGSIWCIGDSLVLGGIYNAGIDPSLPPTVDYGTPQSPRVALRSMLDGAGYDFTYTGHSIENYPDPLFTGAWLPEYFLHSGASGVRIDQVEAGVGTWWNQDNPNFETDLPQNRPNVIILMIGTNDVLQNYQLGTAADRLSSLIGTLYSLTPTVGDATVLVSGIPALTLNPTVAAAVEAYNQTIPAVVEAWSLQGKDIHYVDMSAVTGQYILDDGVHLTAAGNAMVAQQWFGKINELATVQAVPEVSGWLLGLLAMVPWALRRTRLAVR